MITNSLPFGFNYTLIFMNPFQRKQLLKQANLLDLIPMRVNEHTLDTDGKVVVLVPKFKNPFWSKMFIPHSKSKNINVRLDSIGTVVWLSIDGVRTVSQIYDEIAGASVDEIDELESRIHQFILKLYHQRFITFTVLER